MRKQISVTREIQAPAEQVWNEIAKVDGWERWLGVLTGSKAEGREVGSTRVCHTEDGDVLETVEMIDPELRLFQYSIQSAPFPVANALGTLRVKELGEDTTEVTWSLNFDPPDEGVDELIAAIEGIYQDGIAGLERIVQA